METVFHIGDRVRVEDRVRVDNTFLAIVGDEGTIVEIGEIEPSIWRVGVRFDKYIDGHTCGGRCEDGYGWYVLPENLELIGKDEPSLSIPTREEILSFLGV